LSTGPGPKLPHGATGASCIQRRKGRSGLAGFIIGRRAGHRKASFDTAHLPASQEERMRSRIFAAVVTSCLSPSGSGPRVAGLAGPGSSLEGWTEQDDHKEGEGRGETERGNRLVAHLTTAPAVPKTAQPGVEVEGESYQASLLAALMDRRRRGQSEHAAGRKGRSRQQGDACRASFLPLLPSAMTVPRQHRVRHGMLVLRVLLTALPGKQASSVWGQGRWMPHSLERIGNPSHTHSLLRAS
jgi:hypothetical protein